MVLRVKPEPQVLKEQQDLKVPRDHKGHKDQQVTQVLKV